jgi:hypothetical protein
MTRRVIAGNDAPPCCAGITNTHSQQQLQGTRLMLTVSVHNHCISESLQSLVTEAINEQCHRLGEVSTVNI